MDELARPARGPEGAGVSMHMAFAARPSRRAPRPPEAVDFPALRARRAGALLRMRADDVSTKSFLILRSDAKQRVAKDAPQDRRP